MKLGKQVAKFAATGALLALAALPALAQTSVTIHRYRNPVTGNVIERQTVTGRSGRSTVLIRSHRHRHYYRRYHSNTLYMTPYSTRRYYYDSNGYRHYR